MNAETTVNSSDFLKVIAWIDNHPKSVTILNAARKYAKDNNLKWAVAYIEVPLRFPAAEDDGSQHMLRLCTLAEQMGGEVIHVQADSLEKGLISILESEKGRIRLFMVGSVREQGFLRRLLPGRQVWENVIRIAGRYARVEVIPLANPQLGKVHWNWRMISSPNPMHIIYALAAVSLSYLAALILEWSLPPALFRINTQNVSLLFMIACAFVAGRYGLLSGVVAAIASFMTYNYFYVPPYHIWQINSITQLINMCIFLSAGILIALFTSRARSYAENVARRERGTQALFTLYRTASIAFSRQQVLETLQKKLSQMLNIEIAFFLPPVLNPDSIEPTMPADLVLDEVDRSALETCWNEIKSTGASSPLHKNSSWRFEPMVAPGGEIGVFGARPRSGNKFDVWLGYLLANIADHTAVLLEHIEMERSMEANRLREEREKLRAMLLSSVSHDLKTPLAGIIGSLGVYRSVGNRLTPEKRTELLEGAFEEAQRLDSFITNILDMTRLESGKIDFHPEWHDISSAIQRVTKRIQHRLKKRKLIVPPYHDDLEIYMDVMMTEQVLQNLLDNVCKYTPEDTSIEISWKADKQHGFICKVRDYGPGIPEDKFDRVFDKYARLQKEDSQVAGTGLGLAICKAIMEAQGGWITVANHPEGGSEFTFCLPKWRRTGELKEEEVSYAAQ